MGRVGGLAYLCGALKANAREHGDLPAQAWTDEDGRWRHRSWTEYLGLVYDVAAGLVDIGVAPGATVGISARNVPEHAVADLAIVHAGGIPVSVYLTFAENQLEHVVTDSRMQVLFVEAGDPLDRWRKVLPRVDVIEHVVVIGGIEEDRDDERFVAFEDLVARGAQRRKLDDPLPDRILGVHQEDPATLVYTSGTTGEPKGVILTHRNVQAEMDAFSAAYRLGEMPVLISYLPLAHGAERLASHYLSLQKGAHVWFCPETEHLAETLKAARPHLFLAVPRVWEKLSSTLDRRVSNEPNSIKAAIGRRALAEAERAGREGPTVQTRLFDYLMYSKVRTELGFERLELALSGAAPIAPSLLYRFSGMGIPICELYGLTESCGAATGNLQDEIAIGTVGRPLPGVSLRLADDGEILLRGDTITPGYWPQPQGWPDDWLPTGDLGELDAEGRLRIIGRKKELIITSQGKNISPNSVEGHILREPLVADVCAIGDDRKYLVALVALDEDAVAAWDHRRDGRGLTVEQASGLPEVQAVVEAAVDRANEQVSRPEQIKSVAIVPHVWEPGGQLKTPTMKLRRDQIAAAYADLIEELYA